MNKDTLQYIKDRANENKTGSIKAVSCADVRDLIAELEATRASLEMANNSVKHLNATRAGTKAALDTWIESGINGAAEAIAVLDALKSLDNLTNIPVFRQAANKAGYMAQFQTAKDTTRAAITKAEG